MEKIQMQKRNIAYKIWLSNLLNGTFIKREEEFQSDYIETNGYKISRVNLIGNVTFKYESQDGNYLSVTLDDGSFSIRLKAWNEDTRLLQNINQGDMVLVVGKLRKFNDEIYLIPEVVKLIDNPNIEMLRKLELFKEFGKPLVIESKEQIIEEKEIEVNDPYVSVSRKKILEIIESLSNEQGVKIDEVVEKSGLGQEAEQILNELLKEGEVYQPKPQYLKLLE